MSQQHYDELKQHQQAMAFWESAGLEGIGSMHWHFSPRAFVETFRKCGWLSKSELAQLIPNNVIRKPGSHNSNSQGIWESPSITHAMSFIAIHRVAINKTLQKFLITTPLRQACFFGNSVQETSWFRYIKESNGNSPGLHSGWYGRGLLQLTNPNGNLNDGVNNYYRYFKFLGRNPVMPAGVNEISWRNEVGDVSRHACHSAGAYWVWPNKSSPTLSNPGIPLVGNANKYADIYSANSRRTIQTNSGVKAWYLNESFKNCATAVNYPAATGTPSPNMNGLVDRSVAFVNALMVLADRPMFESGVGSQSDAPEDYSRREV